MTVVDLSILDLSDESLETYLGVCFSNADRVTPGEKKKLSGILKHYAKMKHPFTACVNDNTKRFGKDRAEKVCAVLKDIIRGTTKWRGHNMSEEEAVSEFALEIDPITAEYLAEIIDEEFEKMTAEALETEENLSDTQVMAEMYFGSGDAVVEDNLVWKTILREGQWAYSPGAGQKPVAKPITVQLAGSSDAVNNIISMEELKTNFDAGVIQHVTVPTSHADNVLENTGFVKSLRVGKDDQGRHILEAGIEFTEPEVKEKAIRGTVANISSGILFDYVHKESGNRFGSVLAHAALTNHPWLNGMPPFGVNASDDLEVVGFSEEAVEVEEIPPTLSETEGGEVMTVTPEAATVSFEETFGLSEDAIRGMIERNKTLEADNRKNAVTSRVAAWEAEGKTPAVCVAAQEILMSDDGSVSINLSENGQTKSLSLSEVVEKIVAATPNVKLGDEKVTEEDQTTVVPVVGTERENLIASFSEDEKADVVQLMFEERISEDEAITKVAAKKTA